MRLLPLFLFFVFIFGCSAKNTTTAEKKVPENQQVNIIPANYIIGPSDGLEISYYIDPSFKSDDYIIDTEDKLNIDFQYYPELSKAVRVRLDGFVSLHKIGEVKAAGEKPYDLAKKISELYSKQLVKPELTVDVVEFNSKIDTLKDAVRTADRGQLKYVVVRPDGKISLPYLRDDFIAAGKTPLDLSRELEGEYRKNVNNISITVSVLEAKSYQACVLGSINNAGCYNLSGLNTVLNVISRAGGFSKEANLRQVIIISRGKDRKQRHEIININKIINNNQPDVIISQFDIIYVPQTWLSEAALTAEAIWQIIPINLNANIYDNE